MTAMFIVGHLIGWFDTRLFIVTGLLLIAFSLWQMSGFTLDVGVWTIVRTGVVQGFGPGLVFVPFSTTIFAIL